MVIQLIEYNSLEDLNYFLKGIKKENIIKIEKHNNWYVVQYLMQQNELEEV